MRISVVIPVYNSAATIRAALDSVHAQRQRPEEIIVVDDASRDNSLDVVAGIGAEIRVVKMERNAGPAAARNRGIAEASGDWIAFLDADDLWLPDRLALQCEATVRMPDVSLWCGEVIDFVDSDVAERSVGRVGRPGAPSGSPAWTSLVLEDFVAGNRIATSTVLVEKAALLSVGGFDERFRGPEDYDVWMRLAGKFKLGKLDCPLSSYRQRPGSLSQDDRTFLPQVLAVLEKAFASDGVFAEMPWMSNTAMSNQYWNASWMAFNRGSRMTAIRHLTHAFVLNHRAQQKVKRKWGPLLFRYLIGKPENFNR